MSDILDQAKADLVLSAKVDEDEVDRDKALERAKVAALVSIAESLAKLAMCVNTEHPNGSVFIST